MSIVYYEVDESFDAVLVEWYHAGFDRRIDICYARRVARGVGVARPSRFVEVGMVYPRSTIELFRSR